MGQISGSVGLQQWTEGPLADLLGAGLPWKALAGGRTSGIELLVGHTRDEFRLFSVMMGRLVTFTPAPLQRPADTGDLGGLLGIAAGMGPLRHGRRPWVARPSARAAVDPSPGYRVNDPAVPRRDLSPDPGGTRPGPFDLTWTGSSPRGGQAGRVPRDRRLGCRMVRVWSRVPEYAAPFLGACQLAHSRMGLKRMCVPIEQESRVGF